MSIFWKRIARSHWGCQNFDTVDRSWRSCWRNVDEIERCSASARFEARFYLSLKKFKFNKKQWDIKNNSCFLALKFSLAGFLPQRCQRKILLEAKKMTTIRLETEKFSSAQMLAELLEDRLLSISKAGAEVIDDLKSTAYVCSAAFEASIGGEEAAVARGRAARAGRMMIIEEGASAFSVNELLGGKLIRLCIPSLSAGTPADHYGLQLAATLLSDECTVACGDKSSRDLLGLARRVAKKDVTVLSMGRLEPAKRYLRASFITIQTELKPHSLQLIVLPSQTTCWRQFFLATKRAPSPVRRQQTRGFSALPMAARFYLTRSRRCQWLSRPSFFARCRKRP